MVEIGALAATVVSSFLLPYVKMGAKKLGEALAEKAGKSAAEQAAGLAGRIWERVKGAFSSDEERKALDRFRTNPDGPAKAYIEMLLKERLENDEGLRKDLSNMVDSRTSAGDSVVEIVNAGIAGVMHAPGATIWGVAGGVVINDPKSVPSPGKSDPIEEDA